MRYNHFTFIFLLPLMLFVSRSIPGQSFNLTDKIVANDRGSGGGGYFGYAISMWEDDALIGTGNSAYFFKYDTLGQWKHIQKIVPSGPRSTLSGGDLFGSAVSLDNDKAIVGAFKQEFDVQGQNPISGAGAAYIFEKSSNGNWLQAQKIIASDRDSLDHFGCAVSIFGDYAAVGAWGEDKNASGNNTMFGAGAVYIFKRSSSGTWNQIQKIVPTDRAISDNFGFSVSLSHDNLLIGAPYKSKVISSNNSLLSSGAVYLFTKNSSGTWMQTQKIESNDLDRSDKFGNSIDMDSNVAIIGAHYKSDLGILGITSSGAAYIFTQIGNGILNETQKLLAPVRASRDEFGWSVSIDNDKAIVGALWEDEDEYDNNTVNGAGSAYIFIKDSLGNWNNVQKIAAPVRTHQDLFGSAVGISKNYAIVGARREDEDSLEINTIAENGSAYVFGFCSETTSNITESECDSFRSPSFKHLWTKTGTYLDTVRNKYGCDSVITINLTIHADSNPLRFDSIKSENITCFNNANGQINLTATGGSPPYQYNWNTGDTIASLSNLSAGTYSVTITDSLGCSISDSFQIKEPGQLQISRVSYLDVQCYGEADGELNIQALGGTPPYLYSWSTGEQTKSINNLKAGTYNLIITDSNGCNTSADFTIAQPDSLYIKSSELVEASCGKPNGWVTIKIEGGIKPYAVDWSNGQTGDLLQNDGSAPKEDVYVYIFTSNEFNESGYVKILQ